MVGKYIFFTITLFILFSLFACGPSPEKTVPTPTATLATPSIQMTLPQTTTPELIKPPTVESITVTTIPHTSPPSIHGKILYECNHQPVNIRYYAVLFERGKNVTTSRAEADENGEFSFYDLEPGSYSLHYTTRLNVMFSGEGDPVEVKLGKTTSVIYYSNRCPEIKLISPVNDEVVTTSKPTFKWQSMRPLRRRQTLLPSIPATWCPENTNGMYVLKKNPDQAIQYARWMKAS
jgi:hypothetical protein